MCRGSLGDGIHKLTDNPLGKKGGWMENILISFFFRILKTFSSMNRCVFVTVDSEELKDKRVHLISLPVSGQSKCRRLSLLCIIHWHFSNV